jgi:hypothetical protein
MARRKKYKLDTWAPAFGCWNELESELPPAGSTFLGMWVDGGRVRVELAHCYYYDEDGQKVDPEHDEWASIRYWQLRGDQFVEVPEPQLWCEARFVIPVGKAWAKAHGIDHAD